MLPQGFSGLVQGGGMFPFGMQHGSYQNQNPSSNPFPPNWNYGYGANNISRFN